MINSIKEDMEKGNAIYLFGDNEYDIEDNIELVHEGKWIKAIKKSDDRKEYHLDMASQRFLAVYHNGRANQYVNTNSIAKWFRNSNIITHNKKFAKLVLYNKNAYHMKRYSTPVKFIQALCDEKCRIYEQWEALGIKIKDIEDILQKPNLPKPKERYYGSSLSYIYKKPKEVKKDVLNYIRSFDEITIRELDNITSSYFNFEEEKAKKELKDFLEQYAHLFETTRYDYKKHRHVPDSLLNDSYFIGSIYRTITEYNISYEKFIEYIEYLSMFEHTSPSWVRSNYRDYLDAELTLRGGKKRKMEKYPRNLVQAHHNRTAVVAEIEKQKKLLQEKEEFEKEQKVYKDHSHLSYNPTKEKYCIVVPQSSDEIIDEGTNMHHCVGGYCSRIRDGYTFIVFMRKRLTPRESYITVEIKDDTVVTALGYANRNITSEEKAFLMQYAKSKELKFNNGIKVRGD